MEMSENQQCPIIMRAIRQKPVTIQLIAPMMLSIFSAVSFFIVITSLGSKINYNTDILVKLMEDHRAGKADNSRRIWTVYVFLVWYKVYFEDEDFRPINQDWIDNRVRTA